MDERPLENVFDYPRPPRLEAVEERLRVIVDGITIADTTAALRVLETSHPPTYYIPLADIRADLLRETPGAGTFCEWKGRARYWDADIDGVHHSEIAWDYPSPSAGFIALTSHLAFYASRVEACYVGDERVEPQPGGYYGGWITSWIRAQRTR